MELSTLLSCCKVSPKSSSFNESANNNSNVIDIIKNLELKNKELLLLLLKYNYGKKLDIENVFLKFLIQIIMKCII